MGASPLTSTIPSSSSSESELALRLARKSKKKNRQMNNVLLLISGEYRINSSITSKYKNWLFFWNLKMQIGYFDGESWSIVQLNQYTKTESLIEVKGDH